MHSILRIIVLVSLGVAAGAAFAGPNWDAINSARAAAKRSAAAPGAASAKDAMQKQCAEMMKSSADSASPKGPSRRNDRMRFGLVVEARISTQSLTGSKPLDLAASGTGGEQHGT